MPPPVVYVVVALSAAAAVYAFKEFVYEPHIAPKIETWAEDFLQRRRLARNRRQNAPFSASRRRRRDSATSSDSHSSNDEGDVLLNRSRDPDGIERSDPNDLFREAYELDGLASDEVKEWRNEVLRSQERNQGLRRRRTEGTGHDFDGFDTTSTTLDESFPSLTHTPLASTHVISNVSSPITSSTVSLPPTPRRRSRSQSTTISGEASTLFVVPPSLPSPIPELPWDASSVSTAQTHPPADHVHSPISLSPTTPLAMPRPNTSITLVRSPTNDTGLLPLPFTPTYQVMADDCPFGPLLPDTPRSSAEIYGERPFSPISRLMGSSSASSSSSRETLPSRANSVSSSRTFGNSGTYRRGSGLANEVLMGTDIESDDEDTHHTSDIEPMAFSSDNGSLASVASLSERYPAPPTPPVVVSPPTSSIGIISAPSSPSSGGSEVIIGDFRDLPSPPQTQPFPSVPLLRVTSDSVSGSPSRSPVHSAESPTLSFASFLSPLVSREPSESEGDEFLSVGDDESDWDASPVTPGGRTGPVPDTDNNPFLIFEHPLNTNGVREGMSGHGGDSEGSEESEDGSDDSWGSARRH